MLANASVRIFAAEVDSYDLLEVTIMNAARQLVKVLYFYSASNPAISNNLIGIPREL